MSECMLQVVEVGSNRSLMCQSSAGGLLQLQKRSELHGQHTAPCAANFRWLAPQTFCWLPRQASHGLSCSHFLLPACTPSWPV